MRNKDYWRNEENERQYWKCHSKLFTAEKMKPKMNVNQAKVKRERKKELREKEWKKEVTERKRKGEEIKTRGKEEKERKWLRIK